MASTATATKSADFVISRVFNVPRELLWKCFTEPERMKQGIEKLHASLDEAKIQHVFVESPGTDHEWQTWRRNLQDFAPRLF